MPSAPFAENVRRSIRSVCRRLGAPPESELAESILIRDGCYCGRRFRCGPLQAVWFIEEGQVKYYDADGRVTLVTVAGEEDSPQSPLTRRVA